MVNRIERKFMLLKNQENQNYRLIQLKKIRLELMNIIFDQATSNEDIKEAKQLLRQIEICLN